ncbi:MAG: LPS assembly protein LptD [Planctomycetes bacterium]|nr:LPS assembly protein LptD [Planctomycetota bacterium]
MRRFLLASLLAAVPAFPQDEKRQPELECDYAEVVTEGEDRVFYLLNPKLRKDDVEIRADHMILWVPKGGTTLHFRELYAEGNVSYRRGVRELRAERLYYDRAADLAFVLNLRGRGRDPKSGTPFQVSAAQAREIAKGKFEARDISVSMCDYGVPHFDVHLERGTIEGVNERRPDSDTDLFHYDSWKFRGMNLAPRFFGVSLFTIPGFSVGSDQSDFPLRSLRVGHTSRFGATVMSQWGLTLRKGWIDAITPWGNDDEEDDHERWGEVRVDADWRQERGGATGLHARWEWDGYSGYLDSYYLHDLGRSDTGFDENFDPLENPDRGRVRLFHRHDFLPQWRYEVELSYLSDKDLLEEFWPDEFKEGKEQETVLYLRWKKDNLAAFAMERHRLNDFQTQIEAMPRLQLRWLDEPFLSCITDRLLYTNSTELVNQRYRFGSGVPGDDERTWRFDTLHELSAPIDLTFVQIAPYASLRGTFFSTDLAGEDAVRFIGSGGGRIRTDIHGVHDLRIEGIGLNRVRHILQLEARYASNFTADSVEVFPYDATDAAAEFEEASFSVRNRFQTKLLVDGKMQTWEFLDLGLQIEYYPNPLRDTTAFNENNLAPPFHWIALAPPFERRHWSNLHWDVSFRPRSILAVEGRGEVDLDASREEAREISLSLRPFAWLSVAVGQTYYRDITDAYTLGITWRPTEKWTLSIGGQYDVEADSFTKQRSSSAAISTTSSWRGSSRTTRGGTSGGST